MTWSQRGQNQQQLGCMQEETNVRFDEGKQLLSEQQRVSIRKVISLQKSSFAYKYTHTHTHCTLGNDAETSKLQWHFNSVCKHKHTGVFILYWLVQSCVTALTVSSVQTVLYMLSQNTYQQDNAKTILLFPPSAQSGDLKWTRPKWPNVLSRTRQWAHEHSLHL